MAAEAFSDGVGFEGVEGAIFVGGVVFGVWGAVGEGVVFVGFLGVGVGAHLLIDLLVIFDLIELERFAVKIIYCESSVEAETKNNNNYGE